MTNLYRMHRLFNFLVSFFSYNFLSCQFLYIKFILPPQFSPNLMTILSRDLSSFYSLFLRDKYLVYNSHQVVIFLLKKLLLMCVLMCTYITCIFMCVCTHLKVRDTLYCLFSLFIFTWVLGF